MPADASTPSHPSKSYPLFVGIVLAAVVLSALIASWYKDTRSFIFPFINPNMEAQASAANNHLGEPAVTGENLAAASESKGAEWGHPSWSDLTQSQQTVLQGLQEIWPFFSNAEKRRWLATAHSARNLSPEQQATMATQIAHWSKLSEAQRVEMRQLFEEQSETMRLNALAAWVAYNQLSDDEKAQLNRQALGTTRTQPAKAKGSANTRLVRIPAASQARQQLANLPKVQPAPAQAPPPKAQNTITHDAPSNPSETANRQYRWGNIIVTPPDPLPPLYRN